MSIWILVGKLVMNIFSDCTYQTSLSVDEKDSFYIALLNNISITASADQCFVSIVVISMTM